MVIPSDSCSEQPFSPPPPWEIGGRGKKKHLKVEEWGRKNHIGEIAFLQKWGGDCCCGADVRNFGFFIAFAAVCKRGGGLRTKGGNYASCVGGEKKASSGFSSVMLTSSGKGCAHLFS